MEFWHHSGALPCGGTAVYTLVLTLPFTHTQYELALGRFPYPAWKNVFEQLKTVVEGDAPRLNDEDVFSPEFKDFLHLW